VALAFGGFAADYNLYFPYVLQLPIMWTHVVLNVVSQYVCLVGVYGLIGLADQLTVNVALTVLSFVRGGDEKTSLVKLGHFLEQVHEMAVKRIGFTSLGESAAAPGCSRHRFLLLLRLLLRRLRRLRRRHLWVLRGQRWPLHAGSHPLFGAPW
jgi:hypothetical protein